MSIEKRLEELGVELPEVPPAVANYIPGVAVGEVLFLAGTIGQYNGDIPIRGEARRRGQRRGGLPVGAPVRLKPLRHGERVPWRRPGPHRPGRAPRRLCEQRARLSGGAWVVNGESDLLVEVLGEERGKHARAAEHQRTHLRRAGRDHPHPADSPLSVQVRFFVSLTPAGWEARTHPQRLLREIFPTTPRLESTACPNGREGVINVRRRKCDKSKAGSISDFCLPLHSPPPGTFKCNGQSRRLPNRETG